MKHRHGPCCIQPMILLAALALLPAAAYALPNASISDVTVTEGQNSNAVFTVSIDANPASGQDLRLRVATQNGTAVAGQDYSSRSTTLTFRRNRSRSQSFSVPIHNDTSAEASETFKVILANPVNGAIADGEGIGTIVDNDTPANRPPTCSIDAPATGSSIRTGQSVSYTGTVTDPDGDPVTVSWSFGGGTPATSPAQDPGAVICTIAGTFTTTLTASDNRDGSCTSKAAPSR